MSTRSHIGIEGRGGEISVVYLHDMSYPHSAGAILAKHYALRPQVESLIEGGNLSVLGPEIGKRHNFASHHTTAHAKDWCLYYARDRADAGMEAMLCCDRAAFNALADEEFAYLYRKSDAWYGRAAGGPWLPITYLVARYRLGGLKAIVGKGRIVHPR